MPAVVDRDPARRTVEVRAEDDRGGGQAGRRVEDGLGGAPRVQAERPADPEAGGVFGAVAAAVLAPARLDCDRRLTHPAGPQAE